MTELTKREKALVGYIRRNGPLSITELAAAFTMNANTMSVHLQNLRGKGAAWNDGQGRQTRWHAVPKPVKEPAKVDQVSIEQVSSVWHWADRHARAA